MQKNPKKIITVNKNLPKSPTNTHTIQSAINTSPPHTTIQISPGYYKKFKITKPHLTLQSSNPKQNAIIVVDKDQNILIDYTSAGPTIIKNLKFGHTSSEMNLNFNKVVKSFLSSSSKNPQQTNLRNFQNPARFYQPKSYTSSLMKVRSGAVVCVRCLFSFKLLTKAIENSNVGVIVEEGCSVKLVACEVVGHESYGSLGVLVQRANVVMVGCKVYGHLNGGVCAFLERGNVFEISGCVVVNNLYGVDVMGIDGKVFFNDNKVLFNKCEGVKIGISVNAFMVKNEITHNKVGVFLNSCSAKLINNIIKKNKSFGILSTTTENLLNNSEIKMNKILLNEDSGICIQGQNNQTFIKSNLKISENKGCGIILKTHSKTRIFNNYIFSNTKQGILLQETSTSKILHNNIYKNIKANIALGGKNSSDVLIMYNKIYKSTSEGIFLMNSGNSVIYYNSIFENYEGIVVFEGSVDLAFNEVFKNVTNGVCFLKNSLGFLRGNRVFLNEGIGVFVRDCCRPEFGGNFVEENEVDFVCENEEVKGVGLGLGLGKEEERNYIFIKNKICMIF